MTGSLRTNDNAVTEVELKLQLDESAAKAVHDWVVSRGGRRERLRARYFDTSGLSLAESGMALRLRYERGRWVQTLKAALPGAITRFEHEVIVQRGQPDMPPSLDPARHQGSEAAPLLMRALERTGPEGLINHFETDIRRTAVRFRSRRGEVEVCLDSGIIAAPGRHPLPVCEIEVELAKGSPLAVTDVARQVIRGHPCWVDLASKAERGHRLAAGRGQSGAAKARSVSIDAQADSLAAARLVTHECRRQLLANLASIASGTSDDPEYVHQARVAVRRLRTAIRLFDVDPLRNLDEPARALARALGLTRERDVLLESVAPALALAGAPTTDLAALANAGDARSVVRSRDSQVFVVDLLAGELTLARSAAPVMAPAGPQLVARLSQWHRQVRRDSKLFSTLDDERRHRLRRRMKRLRYGIEFCRALCSDKRYRRYLQELSEAQEALGRYNDLIEALASYRAQIESDPRAWFAVGWLTAEAKAQSLRCETALSALRNLKAPWKNRYLAPQAVTAHPAGMADAASHLAPTAAPATAAGAPADHPAREPVKPT